MICLHFCVLCMKRLNRQDYPMFYIFQFLLQIFCFW
ncbi:hypothetical protein E2C01_086042 [Portunus trituberculatus]|uniref:Uncharacterized protein n=1 Tax=Portunus trituberculatus TaxID=210409 RepID=A0A5B7J4E7_PORTR|nr:hypothetical protein [Portunus trituberculatus]